MDVVFYSSFTVAANDVAAAAAGVAAVPDWRSTGLPLASPQTASPGSVAGAVVTPTIGAVPEKSGIEMVELPVSVDVSSEVQFPESSQ
jgi:hypothetical protein